jgi:hypothetical protein
MDSQAKVRGHSKTVYHLQVQDNYSGDYWLHLEMRGDASLEDLDGYLRAIWLECCGHLSCFRIGPTFYTQIFEDGFGIGDEAPMDIQVGKVFRPGMTIPYEYDFGSTTELKIDIIDERAGSPLSPNPIYLMARNDMKPVSCMECDLPAQYICMECLYTREDGACELCEEHAEEHECDDYGGLFPLVNSPRLGVCGYVGPAEPPY